MTDKGTVRADIVVKAADLWGCEVTKLAGYELPLMTIEHQYFVTETIEEIAGLDRRLPSVADRDGEYHLRQKGRRLLVGAYEKGWAILGRRRHATRFRTRFATG